MANHFRHRNELKQRFYNEMIMCMDQMQINTNGQSKNTSRINGATAIVRRPNLSCYKCGEEGHFPRGCPGVERFHSPVRNPLEAELQTVQWEESYQFSIPCCTKRERQNAIGGGTHPDDNGSIFNGAVPMFQTAIGPGNGQPKNRLAARFHLESDEDSDGGVKKNLILPYQNNRYLLKSSKKNRFSK